MFLELERNPDKEEAFYLSNKTKLMSFRIFVTTTFLLFFLSTFSQKKPLDHSVYDSWQSIGERAISNDGKFVVYAVNPEEGDGNLYIQATDSSFKKELPRGYNATISEDNQFVVFRIRPLFKDTRDARIKKKKPEDMPKDSLAIFSLKDLSVVKIPRVKGYKMPEKGSGWLAYQFEKPLPDKKITPDSLAQVTALAKMVDSLSRLTDSLRNKLNEAKTTGIAALNSPKKEEKKSLKPEDPIEEGTELVLRNLQTGEEKKFKLVNDYLFSEKGNAFVIECSKKNGEASSKASVIWMNIEKGKMDTILRGFNDAKSFSFDKEGAQLAFVAERDSVLKALRKFYKLYYYAPGMDSAQMRVDRKTAGVANGLTVNDFANIQFSRDGQKLFFQLAPIRRVKDTTLVDFETARMDIWHYNDDYLVPQQLKQLEQELRRGYTAVIEKGKDRVVQLGSDSAEAITLVDEGNADYVLATSSKGNRIAGQWQGFTMHSGYIVSTKDGSVKTVVKNIRETSLSASPFGNYVIWYDVKKRQWFTYNVKTGATAGITKDIKVALYDVDDDHPDDPDGYGMMGWQEGDKYVYVYDKYDVWKCDPDAKNKPINFTKSEGRNEKMTYRYVPVSKDERYISNNQSLHFRTFDEINKKGGFYIVENVRTFSKYGLGQGAFLVGQPILKAKDSASYLLQLESFNLSPFLENLRVYKVVDNMKDDGPFYKDTVTAGIVATTNPQQKDYNWFTVDLVKWKMFDGKMSEGLLYKPENFDSTKKYPVIFYFYEKNVDTRYQYKMPEPVRASINIPYFVSNGYIVFDPNIYYKNGEPGESAYNSVVSAAKYLSKFKWVDSTKMAIQGHSWGGYQVAYLVTRTNMFAAAESGAPVANMTSAYGGFRWGPGIIREFQYERGQSRIGATLWEKPELYIKNSPLFHADKIKTPLLILDNDQDDAVPWYQGIELFTAMRRLNKKAWMVTYNGEPHGIMERRNRKDWSIRLAQFFDYYLKGAPPAKWIVEGVPATLKGIDWGTETTTEEKKAF
jgi:dipeptidyl aminopeptidase/acylaminoacyl peptidase